MIRENQEIINKLNILIDGMLMFVSVLLGFYVRFYVLDDGTINMPLSSYVVIACLITPAQLFTYREMGLFESNRKGAVHKELAKMFAANVLNFAVLLMTMFLLKDIDFSRGALFIFFAIENLALGIKRVILRAILRSMRRNGYNQKFVVIVGSGIMAQNCLNELASSPELGYKVIGYISKREGALEAPRLGAVVDVEMLIEKYRPDEVLAALEVDEYSEMLRIIRTCEASGTRFSLVPFYASYLPVRPQIDSLNGIPLLNLRRIPLDNWGNAFIKRTIDIIGSLALIILTSPIMLFVAIGVKLSSPGPILFKQVRLGYGKEPFFMYKFRSMRVNAKEKTGWTTNNDPRRTAFGSFIRKYSLDELPQFFNVLKGDMSLIGPRPELPHFVDKFKKEVPLYMVKHQVRPGITGWAQVNGLRGDTSIEKRIEYDVYYIENWSLLLDIQILFMTLRCLPNKEVLVKPHVERGEESYGNSAFEHSDYNTHEYS